MSSTPFLRFLLKGSFLLYGVDQSEERVPISDPVEPSSYDKSLICRYIQQNCPPNFSFLSLLRQIEADHVENKKNYYTNLVTVTIQPGVLPKSPIERIQLLKNILSNLFTIEQIETSSAGRANVAINTLSEWQKFALNASLYHFYNVLNIDGIYQEEEERKIFIHNVLFAYLPKSLSPPKIARIVAPLTLIEGATDIDLPATVYMTVYSPNEITIESNDLLTCHKLKFTEKDAVTDQNIICSSKNIQTNRYKFKFNNNYLSKDSWNVILYPVVGATRTVTSSIIESCIAFEKEPMTIASASLIARAVASMDHRFLFSLYHVLNDERQCLPTIFNSLLNFYAFQSKHMELMKFIGFYELQRTENLNEIFRHNNNFIRSINMFMNRVSQNYTNETLKNIYLMITEFPKWNLENPQEKDAEILKTLLEKFWNKMIETVDQIPPSIRALCRYLRIVSEPSFRMKKMNHRAIFGVFCLRFVFVILVSPADFGIQIEDDPVGYSKVTQFTKILAFSAQFMLPGKKDTPKTILNSAIEETSDIVIQFYEKLTRPIEADDMPVSQSELMKSTPDFCKFVVEHKNEILSSQNEYHYAHIFVDELMNEYVASLQHE